MSRFTPSAPAPKGRVWLQCHTCQEWFLRKASEHEKCLARGRKHSYCSTDCSRANPLRSAPLEDMVGAHVLDLEVRRALASTYRKAREGACKRGIEWFLTKEEFDEIERRANGRCEVSGIAFRDTPTARYERRPFMPSLDRIDARLPYTKGNCRLVSIAVNLAMNNWGAEVFLEIAQGVVRHFEGPARKAA